MGGCKCTFRSCPVTTQKFPKMHFFHYPLNNKERFAKWIEYANYHQIKNLGTSQAKNRTVCALHFRDECFMNYKKNRLTAWAIPTFDRLRNGLVLDYSLPGPLKPTKFTPAKDEHLIAPPGTLIFGNPPDYWTSYATATLSYQSNKRPKQVRHNNDVLEPQPKKICVSEVSVSKEPRILNKGVLSNSSSSNGLFEVDDSTTISLTEEIFGQCDDLEGAEIIASCDIDVEENVTLETNGFATEVFNSNGSIDVDEVEFLSEGHADSVEEQEPDMMSRATYLKTCNVYEEEILQMKNDMEEAKKTEEQKILQLQTELTMAKRLATTAEDNRKAAESKLKECEQKLAALEATNQELLKAKASEPPPVAVKPLVSTPSSSSSLTKAQLFNGIKKYLSASMTALVRMEMFGSSERSWKPDEKQVSVELLRLGEQIYKYFKDEWRFRLPPKKMVEQWTNEVTEEDVDDL